MDTSIWRRIARVARALKASKSAPSRKTRSRSTENLIVPSSASRTFFLVTEAFNACGRRASTKSKRCRAVAVNRVGCGSARPKSRNRWPDCDKRLSIAFSNLLRDSSIRASNSRRTGTAISAAAVGVGARASETKSIKVVSVSCPTAEISGMSLSEAARATASSLNPQRSSIDPPPRATINKSGRGIAHPPGKALKPRMAAETCAAQTSP